MKCMKENDFFLFHQIMDIQRYKMSKLAEKLELRPGQVGILFLIHRHGMLSQNQLAKYLGITAPSMTASIRKLEHRGLVTRQKDSEDRRITRIQMTDEGYRCLKLLVEQEMEIEEKMYTNFSLEEKLLFQRLLGEVRNNLLDDEDFRGKGIKEIIELTRPKEVAKPEDMM